jgi:DNA-binding transcriptional LysR family regulator
MSAADGRTAWTLVGPAGREYTLQHRPRYTANDLLTLKLAVLQGIGMCVLPDYMCERELGEARLVEVLPGWAPRLGVIHAVFPLLRGMVPAVRRLLDFLGEHVRGEHLSAAAD